MKWVFIMKFSKITDGSVLFEPETNEDKEFLDVLLRLISSPMKSLLNQNYCVQSGDAIGKTEVQSPSEVSPHLIPPVLTRQD